MRANRMLKIDLAWAQMQGTRESQQDTVAVLTWPNGFRLLLLADGMGGQAGGEIASKVIVEEFKQSFINNSTAPNMRERLLDALEAANLALYQYISEQPHMQGMGTTLVAVVYDGDSIQWLSVGDSPMWLIRHDCVKRINENHSMAAKLAEQVAAGQLSAEDAAISPDRSQLLEAVLGEDITIFDAPESPAPLQQGDWVIIASDGVETCSEQQLLSLSKHSDAAEDSTDTFVSKVLDSIEQAGKLSQDNASIIALRVTGPVEQSSGDTSGINKVVTARSR